MRSTLLALACTTLPLAGQAWDLRFEASFPEGQSLPETLLTGTSQLVSGTLDTGQGGILTLSHRLIRIGPVLKFEWSLEAAKLKAEGTYTAGTPTGTTLTQEGLGLGLNAQFWIPFTGVAGELGLIQRFHRYTYDVGGERSTEDLSRTWLRVGARWRLPFFAVRPYLAASYQQPFSSDNPVSLGSAEDLAALLSAQGSGQEFERLWTFGVGVQF